MEIIQPHLLDGEQILWSRHHQARNYFWQIIGPFLFSGIIALGFIFLLWNVPTSFPNEGRIIITLIIISFYATVLLFGVRFLLKGLNAAGMTLADLKNYTWIFAVTNKRCILKDINQTRIIKPSQYPPDTILRQKDVLSVWLNSIVHVGVVRVQFREQLSIYVRKDFMKRLMPSPIINLKLKTRDMDTLLTALLPLIPGKHTVPRSTGQPLPPLRDESFDPYSI